ncbi:MULTISPECIES: EamA family transporter [Brevibacillus]|uniref:EamA family transporter n=1 Tax=Brevibacillus TaxID=55080 RepID=UPI000D10929B|nr:MULTISPECIES: DMT family transporter [Brevibacillus]PSJ69932.1 EamA family transporter [Brevibacillus brevis]RED29795.1 threonine/homoserine efflux transporter RhtA [Brevibacillus brevis]TQK74609.1 threonine/homoserine efflux transporter RhtA [Brevibacillus sp. AG162]VEF88344.1 Predicted permease, DMT superfamily [Brevibacillus brevis]GEC90118.1 multidrug transporter [Brevibacillus brevis]
MTYWRSIFLVLLGACSYGVLSIFMKHAFQLGFTPFEMSGSQLIFGGLIMTVMAIFFSKQRFSFKYLLLLAPASLMMASTSLFYHQAVSRVSASLAIVLLFQFTWIGVLLEAIVDRKWPTAEKWVSLVMLGAGTVLASGLGESGIQSVDIVGLIFGLMSGATFALVIFFSGRILPGMDPYLRSAISITMAALMLSIVYPPTFLVNGQLLQGLLPLGLLVAIFGSVIPIFCLAVGVPRIGNGLATILSAVELPTVVLLSSFVLQETVSLPQWGGVFMILAAICVPQVKWRKLFSPSHALEQERM